MVTHRVLVAFALSASAACGPVLDLDETEAELASGAGPGDALVETNATDALVATAGVATGARVLLYGGTGASASDVTALKSILTSMGVTYTTATAAQMNSAT